jgi:hypothetical protein
MIAQHGAAAQRHGFFTPIRPVCHPFPSSIGHYRQRGGVQSLLANRLQGCDHLPFLRRRPSAPWPREQTVCIIHYQNNGQLLYAIKEGCNKDAARGRMHSFPFLICNETIFPSAKACCGCRPPTRQRLGNPQVSDGTKLTTRRLAYLGRYICLCVRGPPAGRCNLGRARIGGRRSG